MKSLRLLPSLEEPDLVGWQQFFPEGLGPSAFSAPALQLLMARELGSGWKLRFLRSEGDGDAEVRLPVFTRTNRLGRHEICVQPTAYYVTPLGHDEVTERTVENVLRALRNPFTAVFTWWLPPWSNVRQSLEAFREMDDRLSLSSVDTYLIPCDRSYEEHMARKVRSARMRDIRLSEERGLELIEQPSPEVVDEYYRLYVRVRGELGWQDQPFSRSFFHGVARDLGSGGQLLVMRHEGRVVGGGVLFYDKRAVHYFQGTTDRACKDVFPHIVLMSEALRRAYARGLEYVNLGGVNDGNKGLVQFKKSWGAVASPVPILRFRSRVLDVGRRVFAALGSLRRGPRA